MFRHAAQSSVKDCSRRLVLTTVIGGLLASASIASAPYARATSSTTAGTEVRASTQVWIPLREGMTHPRVRTLQSRLAMPAATGYFGPLTHAYVLALQKAAGIPATGVVNRRTWRRTGRLGFTPPAITSIAPGHSPKPVAAGGVAARVLAIAASVKGVPYVATGSSPSTGFNCSSYTKWVYAQAGLDVGDAYTVTQYQRSRHVSRAQAKPGDLIFYYNFKNNFLGHMGIYAGNNMFWHSPRTGRVVSLDPIYSDKVLFGRVL